MDEAALVAGKRGGAPRLGFALLLRFYTERGRLLTVSLNGDHEGLDRHW
ncbi:hypothetical protein MYCOZU1_05954 (plasmid) [Mycobacterium intracellulare subsp. chimaera]|nr:hypothetical protein MYCOZU1_05954 [Mycobacterium intracellulare subsp. chimaera]